MFAVLTFLSPETVLDFATRNPTFREIETYYLNIKRKLARNLNLQISKNIKIR